MYNERVLAVGLFFISHYARLNYSSFQLSSAFLSSHKGRHYLNNDLVRRLLLLGLVKNVHGPPRLVGNVGDVETTGLVLADALDLLKVLAGKLNLLEVLLDARGSDGLGDNGVAANLGPGKDDLGGSGLVLLSDLLDDVVLNEKRETKHVVSESLE